MAPLNLPRGVWIAAAGAIGGLGLILLKNRFGPAAPPERRSSERAARPTTRTVDAAPAPTGAAAPAGGVKELVEFLAGETWFDEAGWRSVWLRGSVSDPGGWLKTEGLGVLATQRKSLEDSPALLAGCRRRWIVVARYAGLDVAEAAHLWNRTD